MTLIYIYIVSPLIEGGFILGVSAGCQPPFLQGVAVVRLSMVGLAGTVSHVWRHLCVSLSVVVSTPRLVCALSAVPLRLSAAYPVFLDAHTYIQPGKSSHKAAPT